MFFAAPREMEGSRSRKTALVWFLSAVAVSCILLAGCGQDGSPRPATTNATGNASETTAQAPEATTRLRTAEIELRPVANSSVSAKARFQEIPEGLQFTLEVSELPEPNKSYYSQVHGGSCSNVRGSGRPGGAGTGPSLALVRLDRLLAPEKGPEYADHPKFPPPPDDEFPGNIDAPVGIVASYDGTAFVTALLEGVAIEQLTSGAPKYLDVSLPNSKNPEEWPILACADLSEGGEPGE